MEKQAFLTSEKNSKLFFDQFYWHNEFNTPIAWIIFLKINQALEWFCGNFLLMANKCKIISIWDA